MGTRLLTSKKELLKLASERVNLPGKKPIRISYDEDVDALFLKYSVEPSVISKSEDTDGIIYDYDEKDNLVSIEILDLYGVFA